MKVLLLSSEVVPERAGGIASYTDVIAPALAERGHEVHVLSCAPEHEHRDDHERGVWWHRRRLVGGNRAPTRDSYRQTATRLATSVSCRRHLARLDTRFDVIESPEWLAESFLLGFTQRTPIVVNLHTPLHVLFSYDVRRFSRDLRVADRFERASVRRARVVTSSSELLARTLLADGWLRRLPRVVPYPVDVDSWAGSPSADTSKPSILVVGRLEPRKAPELAVEAAARLAEEVPDLELVFVGRTRGFREGRPYGEWVASLAERVGVTTQFVPQGPHDRMAALYAQARVVVVPSHFESFSVAALEAMASARPVVYSSGVGAREVLGRGDAGTEFTAGDPVALAEALRPYLLDPRRAADAGCEGRRVASAYCAPDIIAEQRERCYAEAMA